MSAQDNSRSESIRSATIDLFEAVENHDVDAARTALNNGADVNGVVEAHPAGGDFSEIADTGPATPLIAALYHSKNGQHTVDSMVEVLVARGADVNFSPDGGLPPVVHAREQPAHLSYLLDRGANPDARFTELSPPSETEQTILHWAAGCCPGVTEMLLQYGANPNATASGHGGDGGWKYKPLYKAFPDQIEVARMLLRYGQRPSRWIHTEILPGMPSGPSRATALDLLSQFSLSDSKEKEWRNLIRRADQQELDSKSSNPPLLVTDVDASSTLKDDSEPYRYSGANAFDGNPETAWVENVNGGGGVERPGDPSEVDGECITLAFNQPVAFDAVEVMPGYFKTDVWALNNRVRSLGLWGHVSEEGTSNDPKTAYIGSVEFEDRKEGQTYELETVQEAEILTFEIRSVYEGERWDDTPISEIALYREGERIELEGNLADADSPVVISKDDR